MWFVESHGVEVSMYGLSCRCEGWRDAGFGRAVDIVGYTLDWILVKFISYDKYTKIYTLSDEDKESDKICTIPAVQVVPLKGAERNRYNRGDVVYAVYPDTTVFYHATVGSTTKTGFVLVTFQDDGDENGITHEKAVPLGLVMKVPV